MLLASLALMIFTQSAWPKLGPKAAVLMEAAPMAGRWPVANTLATATATATVAAVLIATGPRLLRWLVVRLKLLLVQLALLHLSEGGPLWSSWRALAAWPLVQYELHKLIGLEAREHPARAARPLLPPPPPDQPPAGPTDRPIHDALTDPPAHLTDRQRTLPRAPPFSFRSPPTPPLPPRARTPSLARA